MPATMGAMLGVKATAASTAAIATEATVATMAMAGVSGYSYMQQSQTQKAQGKYQQELALREAEMTEEASEHEQRETRREARAMKEKQLTQFAGGGVVPSTGTPLKVISETQAGYEADIGLQKYGYGLQAGKLRSRAQMEKLLGKSKSRASRYQAGTSLATGIYRTSSLYMDN